MSATATKQQPQPKQPQQPPAQSAESPPSSGTIPPLLTKFGISPDKYRFRLAGLAGGFWSEVSMAENTTGWCAAKFQLDNDPVESPGLGRLLGNAAMDYGRRAVEEEFAGESKGLPEVQAMRQATHRAEAAAAELANIQGELAAAERRHAELSAGSGGAEAIGWSMRDLEGVRQRVADARAGLEAVAGPAEAAKQAAREAGKAAYLRAVATVKARARADYETLAGDGPPSPWIAAMIASYALLTFGIPSEHAGGHLVERVLAEAGAAG